MENNKRKGSFWKAFLLSAAVLFSCVGILRVDTRNVQAAVTGFYEMYGNTYYMNTNGENCRGWLHIGSDTYFFDTRTGIMATGWVTCTENRMRYFDEKGVMATGWTRIDGKVYYFTPGNGFMKTGWLTYGSRKYLLNNRTGAMITKWYVDSLGQRRYFHATKGYMYTGWYELLGKKRYFDTSTGILGSGVTKVGNKYYYFDTSNGYMKYGWITSSVGDQYYADPSSGELATGTVTIDGDECVFSEEGIFLYKESDLSGGAQDDLIRQGKTIRNLMVSALKPIGSTLYLYGGGHDADAYRSGLNPNWKKAYDSGSYAYGLDCSGYVGWSIYQVMKTPSTGWSGSMIDMYVSRGWGTKTPLSSITKFRCGDILAHEDHIWMILGQCADGSVVIVHSSGTAGPQIVGTPTRAGNWNSQAYNLAATYMKRYSGYYKYQYDLGYNMWGDSRTYVFRWNRNTLADPNGYTAMTADAILNSLSPLIGD